MRCDHTEETGTTVVVPATFDVLDRERLSEAQAFAAKVGKTGSLAECFDTLHRIATNYSGRVRLMQDFAPYSFYFEITRGNGIGLNGGVIYHGAHDRGGDGGAPTFSVCVNPTDGWAIHT
jgi:hypothetical protein